MDIVVLAGGLSSERDVSLSSGGMVAAALARLGHRVVPADSFLGLPGAPSPIASLFERGGEIPQYRVPQTAPDLDAVRASRPAGGLGEIGPGVIELCRAADIVYLGLHGDNGENGRIQAFFDILGIRYTGAGYLGSALAMNKTISKDIFRQSGVPAPPGKTFYKGGGLDGLEEIGFPCIVKPCSGGSSIGVAKAEDEARLAAAIDEVFALEDEIIVERFISGREFSVGILGDTALPPIEIVPKGGFYDYAHKYQPGWAEEICPADLTKAQDSEMRRLALLAFRALRLSVAARGEFLMDAAGNLFCLEMNTLPGMTPTSLLPQEAAAAGIGYDELCGRIVALSMEKYL